jgi:hypothetical protein
MERSMNMLKIFAVGILSIIYAMPAMAGDNGATARDYLMAAKYLMVDRLGVPDTVKFSNIRIGSNARSSKVMVCGWLTVETIPGEATASAPFISFIDTATMHAVSASVGNGGYNSRYIMNMCR